MIIHINQIFELFLPCSNLSVNWTYKLPDSGFTEIHRNISPEYNARVQNVWKFLLKLKLELILNFLRLSSCIVLKEYE